MGMTAAVYFQSVRSYYGFYLHSELHKAEPALCDGRSMCCTLWHFGVLTCVCVCACVYRLPLPRRSRPLLSQHASTRLLSKSFWSSSSLVLFSPHSSPSLFITASCFRVPLGTPPLPFLLSPPRLPLSCSLILLPQSHFIASPFYLHPSSYSFFLTALGKLVDLVSPARTQWSPACCPGNTGRSLTNSILSKEWKDKDWRRAGRMTFLLIWGMFIKHKSRPASGGQSWSAGQRQEVRPEGN